MQGVAGAIHTGPLVGARRFATTRWSLVIEAGTPDGTRALSALCRAYWAPVHAFILGHGLTPDDAADVTQGFFERFLMRGDITRVDQARGRFRSWLRKCAHNYLRNWFAQRKALKVGGKALHVDVDLVASELKSEETPQHLFERRWALTLMERALERLRKRYQRLHKEDVFAHLHVELAGAPNEAKDEDIARLLGRRIKSLRVERHRLKQRFSECLRAEVRDTVADEADIDDEIRRMIDVLA